MNLSHDALQRAILAALDSDDYDYALLWMAEYYRRFPDERPAFRADVAHLWGLVTT